MPNSDQFVGEICRGGKAGYLEYPTIYYDYIYNFPEHTTFVKRKQDKLFWMPKAQTPLDEFQLVQDLFYESLSQRYFDLVDDLKPFFFEGFEWFEPILTRKTSDLKDVVFDSFETLLKKPSFESRIKNFSLARTLGKIRRSLLK